MNKLIEKFLNKIEYVQNIIEISLNRVPISMIRLNRLMFEIKLNELNLNIQYPLN